MAFTVKEGGLILAGIVLPLLVFEILLRLTSFGTVLPQMDFDQNARMLLRTGHLVSDRRLLWREADPGPSDDERPLNVIRVGDAAPPKSSKLRLLCLGDSCTRLSARGMPYSRLLEEQLGPDRVEVFNASIPGYSSHQGLAWLRAQLLAYEPDLLIVYFGWNDHWRTTGWTDRQLAARLAWWQPRVLNLLQRAYDPPPLRVPPEEFAENMRAIADVVAAQGGETLFVTPPALFTEAAERRHVEAGYILAGDDLSAIHALYQQEIRRLSAAPRARIFDAAKLFDLLQAPDLLFPDGIHPTDVGHHVLAVTLADEIAIHNLGAPNLNSNPVAMALTALAQSLAASNRWEEALQRSQRAVEAAPQDLDVLLGYAWLLAACPVDSFRDPERALAKLDAYTGPTARSYMFHDVRAVALAARGCYSEAVAAAEEALRELKVSGDDAGLAAGIRGRVARYTAGQPYLLPARAQ